MLDLAINNRQQVTNLYSSHIGKRDNIYYQFMSHTNFILSIADNDWRLIQYVSKDDSENVIAFFEARIDRSFNIIEDLLAIKFIPQESYTFSLDFFEFIYLLCKDYGVRKIFGRAITANPAFSMYAKILDSANFGKITGVLKEYAVLRDTRIYDIAIMEIIPEKYIKWYDKLVENFI